MYGESNMEMHMIMCKIRSQWEFAVSRRELNQGLCDNLEGWDGEGGGGNTGGRGHVDAYRWFMLIFGRKQQNSIKQLSFN